MKKIFLVLTAMFCVATVSAQNSVVNAITSQKWSVGARVGTGFQAQAECFYSDKAYVEARLGFQYVDGFGADFTVLHNWNVCTMDWTPSAGQWFFDAGVGINVGGAAHIATLGVAGQAKLGIKFNAAPIRLALDFTPSFGPWMTYGFGKGNNGYGFYTMGLCNLGISATYCF